MICIKALFEIREKEDIDPHFALYFLIGCFLFGFLLGWLIQFTIAVINKYEKLRKVKNSIYFGFFCMFVALPPASNAKQDIFSTGTLVSVLVAGVCGFFGWLLLKKIYKIIKPYLDKYLTPTPEAEERKRLLDWLRDTSPAKSYFINTIKDMLRKNQNTRTIPKTPLLPDVTGYDKPETPLYGELVNWMKNLVGLETRPYDTVEQKSTSLYIGDKDNQQMIDMGIRFCDDRENPYVRLSVEGK